MSVVFDRPNKGPIEITLRTAEDIKKLGKPALQRMQSAASGIVEQPGDVYTESGTEYSRTHSNIKKGCGYTLASSRCGNQNSNAVITLRPSEEDPLPAHCFNGIIHIEEGAFDAVADKVPGLIEDYKATCPK